MSFLNATLMLGIAAAAIPLVLHLIARREPKRLVFPAVRFLTQKIDVNRSRLRIRRWMLLAFRAALLALLAAALARPQIHQAASGTWLTIGILAVAAIGLLALAALATTRQYARGLVLGLLAGGAALLVVALGWAGFVWAGSTPVSVSDNAPAAIAIVIDNSPRSGLVTDDGTRLEQMQATATWLVSRYPPDSRIAILDRSMRPASFALDAAVAMRRVEKLEPRQTVEPLADRIESAVRLVRSSELERRAVFVLSDLSRESWTPADAPDAALALPPLLAELPEVAVQVIRPEASPVATETVIENRRLGLPRISDATPPREVTVPLSVTVAVERTNLASMAEGTANTETPASNASTMNTPPVTVRCELQLYELSSQLPVIRDSKTLLPPLSVVDRTSAQVTPDAPAELFLTLPPLQPGTHHGRIQLLGNDPLAVDDVRYFTVTVRRPARVLVVSDDTAAADHLVRTLNAEFDPADPRAEFAIERMGSRKFNAKALMGLDAVALIDPAPQDWTPELTTAVMQWVQSGGNLFVAFGRAGQETTLPSTSVRPATSSDDGGTDAAAMAASQLFPLRRIWRVPPPGTFLETTRPSHPILSELSELAGGIPWNAFRVHRYWQMDPQPTDVVLARYAGTQHGALVDRSLGGGHIVLMTTPIAPSARHPLASWNSLYSETDAWPAFLLLRQIFDYVGNRDRGTFNVGVGSPIAIPLDIASAADNDEADRDDSQPALAERLQMFTAEQPPVPVPVSDGLATVGATSLAGNYWLRGADTPIGFSTNLPEQATQLATIDPALLTDILGDGNFELVADREDIIAAEGRSNEARPLYAQAMLLVLILFLFEQLLANRFYKSSRLTSAAPAALRAALRTPGAR